MINFNFRTLDIISFRLTCSRFSEITVTQKEMLKFKNPFGNPFQVENTEAKEEKVDEFSYVPSAYCQLMDEMIGIRTRPWNANRSPVKLLQVDLLSI